MIAIKQYFKSAFIFLKDKRVQFAGIAIALYIIFHLPIESIIKGSIVKYLFSQIASAWYNDAIFSLAAIFSILALLKKLSNYRSSAQFSLFLVCASLVYVYYRFFSNHWEFQGFYAIPTIKYADFLILLTIENIILLFPLKRKADQKTESSFFDDKALRDTSTDSFGFNEYAKALAEKVQISNFEASFSIGITGKWGSGKTSFINLFKNNLTDRKNIIEVEFNAWNSLTPQAIIKDFFDTLQEKIKPYHSTIPRLLRAYSKKLLALDKNSFTQVLEASVLVITGLDSLNHLFSEIDKALKEINKKLIIYIDDIDRLNKEEIIEIIRLIRNTANFGNTFFIVAYDRNYVIKALDSHNPFNHEQFLEKIFQVEVTLPYYNKNVLMSKLAGNLKTAFPREYHQKISECLHGSTTFAPISFDGWLETMRDVTRLSNAVCLNLTQLLGEVELSDFLKIEMLRLKYPAVYELLYLKTNQFLKAVQKNDKIYVYQLSTMRDRFKDEKKDEKYLKCFLEENWKVLSVSENDIEKVFAFVNSIFSDHFSNSYINRPMLSIIFPSKFKRYFAYTLLDDNLSEIEFGNARSLNQENFNAKILAWLEKGLANDVQSRFEQVEGYDNREDFEKIIRGIFYLANIKYEDSENIVDFNRKNLFDKLSDYNSKIPNTFYSENGGNGTYKEFVKSTLSNASSPFKYEREFIASVMDSYDQYSSFPLSKDELGIISLDYLRKYTIEISKVDVHLFGLFWCTKRTDLVTDNGHTYFKQGLMPEEAKNLVVNFILEKDREGFMTWIIEPSMPGKKEYCISKTAETIFNGWGNFEKEYVDNLDETSEYVKEFKAFYFKFRDANFSQYVPFEFSHIPIAG